MHARAILWIALFLAHDVVTASNAVEPATAAPQSSQPNAAKSPYVLARLADVDPRLESILSEWERAASRIRRRDCTFQRFRYENAFNVELRGTGTLALDVEGRGAYKLVPAAIRAGQVSQRHDRSGTPYQLTADHCQRWHWTGKSVIQVDENGRSFEEFPLPPELVNKQIGNSIPGADREFHPDPPALPADDESSSESPQANELTVANDFSQCSAPKALSPHLAADSATKPPTFGEWLASVVIGMIMADALSKDDWSQCMAAYIPLPRDFFLETRADKLKKQFRIKLLKENDSEAWLQFIPRRGGYYFDRAILILNTGDYKPVAIKLFDGAGGETVHIFSDVQSHLRSNVWFVPPLDRPDLRGYRRISSNSR